MTKNHGIDKTVIRALPLFAPMGDEALDDVLRDVVSRRFATGDAVFEQGQDATHFFVLLHGRLKVHRVTADGQQVIVRIVHPGDLFGIARALRRADYPGTAVAAAESVALCWPMDCWGGLIERHPALAVAAMQTIGTRLQEAQLRLLEMATEEVERRLAHAVLRLIQQAGRRESGGIRIDFPLSRQDLAEMTGTTLHTVSRIISSWEGAGIVAAGRQKLLVRDPHRLVLRGEGRDRP